jgi:hypothetical protein
MSWLLIAIGHQKNFDRRERRKFIVATSVCVAGKLRSIRSDRLNAAIAAVCILG